MPASPLFLRLDVTGQPVRWIGWQEAVVLQATEKVAWNAGERVFTFYGGHNRRSGRRSSVQVNSIVAVKGVRRQIAGNGLVPPLSNRELFLRDGHLCMYCGKEYRASALTRDHLIPLSRGGRDCWSNVVTACRGCNHAKGAYTLDEAGLSLLAIPYVPNRAEYLVLSNRRILADQMEFLKKRFRNVSRLRLPQ
ncbi:MAG: HNH endonuclease [Gammaproteobacteria bacterium]|nr:MAG: HNH endonuclease [Gammaproteobacteria bacterium]